MDRTATGQGWVASFKGNDPSQTATSPSTAVHSPVVRPRFPVTVGDPARLPESQSLDRSVTRVPSSMPVWTGSEMAQETRAALAAVASGGEHGKARSRRPLPAGAAMTLANSTRRHR